MAFVSGDNVFSPNSEWFGFLKEGNLLYSHEGDFVGYLMNDDRVFRNKIEPRRPRLPRPLKPLRPLTPLRPLKRLRSTPPRYPYEDAFESGTEFSTPEQKRSLDSIQAVEGADIFAADNQFLGRISRNAYDQYALANKYQPHGSPYSQTSIFNKYGKYGSQYNALSPFNEYSRTPPRIVQGKKVVAYLTANQFITPRVDPKALLVWLNQSQ